MSGVGGRDVPAAGRSAARERSVPVSTTASVGRSSAGGVATAMPTSVVRRLSMLDRFLPLWIFAAMALGLVLGRLLPGLGAALDQVKVAGVSVPIGAGLLWMMYPVLAKVRYESIGQHVRDRKLLGTSLLFNWVLGPLVMLALAWAFLPDLPAYRNGLVLIGLARCIAMVLIWNSLACGSGELAAVLVALNSVFQILTYSVLGWLFLSVVPGWFGAETAAVHVSMWDIARSVLIFLGIPLLAGYLTRRVLVARRGEAWYTNRFMPKFGPTALLGLLYTIVLMFAMQGDRILQLPLDVLRIAVPLLIYFAVMFGLAFVLSMKLGFGYEETASLSFTAAGNNFELAIAVAVATFGIGSGEALAAVVGPLIEVPALIGLVYVSLWARGRYFASSAAPLH
jgi:ACR3 family arsenite transporter